MITINKCSICKNKIEVEPISGWTGGHNPWPIQDKGRCCTECNDELVVPARLTMALGITVKEAHKLNKEINNVNADRV